MTTLFFKISAVISIFFALCFIVLFACYFFVHNKANKSFKVVDSDD